jgi:MYXO-CTERM domain-containing protein
LDVGETFSDSGENFEFRKEAFFFQGGERSSQMKRIVYVLAAVALLALPMTTSAWTIELDIVQSGTGAEEIVLSPGFGTATIQADIKLTSDYQTGTGPFAKGLDGIQYQLLPHQGTGGVGTLVDDKVNMVTDGTAWVNGTAFGVGDYAGWMYTYPPFGAPYNNLQTLNTAVVIEGTTYFGSELYFKNTGTRLPCTDELVCTYKFVITEADLSACQNQTMVFNVIGDDYGYDNAPAPKADIGHGYTGGKTLTIVIPEPATALLLLGAIPFLRRRRA